MWHLKDLTFINFMSFPLGKINFEERGMVGSTTLIMGENRDKLDEASSNGSGKSTILKAVRIALTDQPEAKKSRSDYIRWGTKKCVVKLSLHNYMTGDILTIIRTYKIKGGNDLKLNINGNDLDDIPSINEGNKTILTFLGISKENLLNYYFVTSENRDVFFTTSDKEKKGLLTGFLGIDMTNKIVDMISEESKEIMNKMEGEEGLLEDYKEMLSDLEEDESKSQDSSTAFKEALLNYESNLADLVQSSKELGEDVKAATKTYNEINSKTVEIENSASPEGEEKLKNLEEKLEKLTLSKTKLRNEIREIEPELIQQKANLAGEVTCPNCGHAFSATELEMSLDDIKYLIKEIEGMIGKLKKRRAKVEEKIASTQEDYFSLEAEIGSAKDRLEEHRNNVRRFRRLYENSVKSHKNSLISVEKFKANKPKKEDFNFKPDLKAKLRIEKLIRNKESSLNKIRKEVDFKLVCLEALKKFKIWAVDESLSDIEWRVNEVLNSFQTPFKISFQGFITLKNGNVREKIDISVIKGDSPDSFPFFSLSTGQRIKVIISTLFVIQDLINQSSGNGGLDMLFLDETFEGLDERGQAKTYEIIKRLGRTIMVMSHMNETATDESELRVIYENGCSKLN